MKVNVEEIKQTPDNQLEINFSDYIGDINPEEKVQAKLTASVCDFDVNIKGNIKAELLLQCDRCLENFIHNVDLNINEDFMNEKLADTYQKEQELSKNDFVEILDENNEIDIKDLVYQSILLDIPNKRLCNEECQGIQNTIINKNEENIDERLEVFKRFSENNFDE